MGPLFWLPTRGRGSEVIRSSQTCVDVVGQPEISLVDFNGLTGLNFITGSQGLCFYVPLPVPVNSQNGFYVWFNTGTENASVIGSNNAVEVDIQTTDTAVSIVAEAVSAINASPYSTQISPSQVNGAGSNTGLNLTAQGDVQYGTVTDGISGSSLTGAAFSQTQPGYPSGHYCTPTSDALAGIPNIKGRFQVTYGGVEYNSSLGGAPAYTTKSLSGDQLLFKDALMTIPAVSSGDTVEAIIDPSTGKTLIQSNSMNAGILRFKQNSLGIWCPVVDLTSSGTGMLSNLSVSMPWIISIASLQTGVPALSGSRPVCSTTINAIISPVRTNDSWFLAGDVFSGGGTGAIGLNIWNISAMSAISGNNAKAWLSGVDITNGSTSSQDFGTLGIGAVSAAAESPYGFISSVFVYDPSNQAAVESYMAQLIP